MRNIHLTKLYPVETGEYISDFISAHGDHLLKGIIVEVSDARQLVMFLHKCTPLNVVQKHDLHEIFGSEHKSRGFFFSIKGVLLNSQKKFTPGLCITGMHIDKKEISKTREQLNTS